MTDEHETGSIVAFDDLDHTEHAHEFVRRAWRRAVLDHPRPFGTGVGPKLHRHPYAEVFVVHSGQATFRIGDATAIVDAGHVVVSPPGEAHGFVNTGPAQLPDRHPRRRPLRHRVAVWSGPGLDVEASLASLGPAFRSGSRQWGTLDT